MENTIENKSKFFAQYLGQMVVYPDIDGKLKEHKLVSVGFEYLQLNYKRKYKGCVGVDISFKPNGSHNSDATNAKLKLRPLVKMSENECANISRLIGNNSNLSKNIKEDGIDILWYFSNDHTSIFSIQDYVRSIGVIVPFMGLSVDELVSFGWVVLE